MKHTSKLKIIIKAALSFCALARSITVRSPFGHRSITVQSPFGHRSITVSSPYLARISPVSAPSVPLWCKDAARRIKAVIHESCNHWGEIPAFTGKSPPRRR